MATAFSLEPWQRSGPARFTADEFLAMCEAGAFGDRTRRLELDDGILVEKPMPGWTHGELQAWIAHLLLTTVARQYAVLADISVRLSAERVRDIDVAVAWASARKPGAVGPEALALAVEIADSTLATDLHVKAVEYAQAGIPEYWVLDPAAEVVHRMTEPGPAGYARRAAVRFAEPLAAPGGGTITIAR